MKEGRPPLSLLKYFGSRLGTQATMDTKNNKFFLKGLHTISTLQAILDEFIQKFILCPRCTNPETVVNTNNTRIKCIACGYYGKYL